MKKVLKALLMLSIATLVTVLVGCESKPQEKEYVFKMYDTVKDEEVIISKIILGDITVDDVIENYKTIYAENIAGEDELLVNSVKESLPNITVSNDGDIVILSFDKILSNMGAMTESKYIENLCYSILVNYDEYKGAYINVNGEEYASGHLLYGVDELITIEEDVIIK